MGRKVRIESDDVLIIRTAPIFQPLLAPARYKDSAPARARHEAPDGQAHPQPTDQPPSPPTRAGVASKPQSRPGTISGHIAAPPLRFLPRRLIAATSAQSPPTASPGIPQAPSSPPPLT